ncbi:MAG TPA: pyridoxal-phosphate dependent enzyme [Solirubrobacteraceae bacterium]|jgi:threonine dehydratase|nr:pyridoxal-phosphate dependent enzyme [Solirubrobacteraceae bacterium]
MSRVVALPAASDLAAAEQVVRRVLAQTPVVEALGVCLKVETVQPTGSFKVRGALAALDALPPGPVVTASAGNHGLGVAKAAALLGRQATVVVPETASMAKVERLREFAVELVLAGSSYDEAEAHALGLEGSYVSPYNDPLVIAGQRTLGVELGEQLAGPLTVVVPAGGGGLLAGVALWASERADVRVVGVEAAASRALSSSVEAARVVEVEVGPTLADGIAGGLEPGSITVDIAARAVDGFAAVEESELRAAMRALALEAGLVAEGAGAAATAAVLAGRVADERPGARVVAVVSGRNLTREVLVDVLAS